MPYILPAARRCPAGLGLRDGRLAACPTNPNCVSTQAPPGRARVEPLGYTGTRDDARARLLALIAADPLARLVTAEREYIHAEWRAFVFVDDVEFYLPADEPVVHLRSASRLGRSDLGANRRRYRAIAAAFTSPS